MLLKNGKTKFKIVIPMGKLLWSKEEEKTLQYPMLKIENFQNFEMNQFEN